MYISTSKFSIYVTQRMYRRLQGISAHKQQHLAFEDELDVGTEHQ